MDKKNGRMKALNISLLILLSAGLLYGNHVLDDQDIHTREDLSRAAGESLENLASYGFGADSYRETAAGTRRAEKAESKAAKGKGNTTPLIQTVSERDEALGLIHLGLLETDTDEGRDLDRARQAAVLSVTQITVGDYYGSGVIFGVDEEKITICSNRHLLQYGESGEIMFYDGTIAQGEIVGISKQYDVGFIQVPLTDIPMELIKNIRYISINESCYDSLGQGDEIVLIGSADGVAQSIYEGTIGSMWYYIEDLESYMIYNYCYAKPGMSGGGTFDAHGHYIGMITGGNGTESASLPLTVILGEYEKITGTALEFSGR